MTALFRPEPAPWPSTLAGLPRLLTRAVPALGLACLAVTLLSAPAYAGTWQFSCTGSGQGTSATTMPPGFNQSSTYPWSPPASATGTSYTVPGLSFSVYSGSAGPGTHTTGDISITAHIKMTWVPDPSLPSDPAPTSIYLIESSTASFEGYYINGGVTHLGTGPADDGCQDPVVPTTSNGAQTGGVSSTGNAASTTLPPPHWFSQAVSGNSFTLDRTFKTHSEVTVPSNISATIEASCSFSGYTLSIHAQPYNFHQTYVTDNGDGTLSFTYAWSSTDGSLAHLDPSCLVHEYVTYPGGNPYTPPLPFFLTDPDTGQPYKIPNPTITPSPYAKGSQGAIPDDQTLWGTVQPYTNQSVTATQTWEFDDSATGQTNQQIPGPDSGPLSIVRAVGPRTPPYIGTWYSVTKNGTTAWLLLSRQ